MFARKNGYNCGVRAALAADALAGLPRAREAHDWAWNALLKEPAYGINYNGHQWAIAPEVGVT